MNNDQNLFISRVIRKLVYENKYNNLPISNIYSLSNINNEKIFYKCSCSYEIINYIYILSRKENNKTEICTRCGNLDNKCNSFSLTYLTYYNFIKVFNIFDEKIFKFIEKSLKGYYLLK